MFSGILVTHSKQPVTVEWFWFFGFFPFRLTPRYSYFPFHCISVFTCNLRLHHSDSNSDGAAYERKVYTQCREAMTFYSRSLYLPNLNTNTLL